MSDILISGETAPIDEIANVQAERKDIATPYKVARGDIPAVIMKPYIEEAEHMIQIMLEEQRKAADKIDEILKNHPKKIAQNERVTLLDLQMRSSGNEKEESELKVKPGQLILAKVYFIYDTEKMTNPDSFDPNSLNQIILGFDGAGAKTCLFHGFVPKHGQVKGEKIFAFHAPQEAGEYDIRFRYAQAYTPSDAVKHWWDVDGSPPENATIGKVTVGV